MHKRVSAVRLGGMLVVTALIATVAVVAAQGSSGSKSLVSGKTFYQGRTKLGVSVLPEDVAEAIAFFAGPRSAKSTGNILNVDGGVTAAYPR